MKMLRGLLAGCLAAGTSGLVMYLLVGGQGRQHIRLFHALAITLGFFLAVTVAERFVEARCYWRNLGVAALAFFGGLALAALAAVGLSHLGIARAVVPPGGLPSQIASFLLLYLLWGTIFCAWWAIPAMAGLGLLWRRLWGTLR